MCYAISILSRKNLLLDVQKEKYRIWVSHVPIQEYKEVVTVCPNREFTCRYVRSA
jgi:hypothetical protein